MNNLQDIYNMIIGSSLKSHIFIKKFFAYCILTLFIIITFFIHDIKTHTFLCKHKIMAPDNINRNSIFFFFFLGNSTREHI